MPILNEELDLLSKCGVLKTEMPEVITSNLDPAFPLRDHQKEALARFIFYATDYRVRIQPVDNFQAANPQDLSVLFTTIQGLYSSPRRLGKTPLPMRICRTRRRRSSPMKPTTSMLSKDYSLKPIEAGHKITVMFENREFRLVGLPFYNEQVKKREFEEAFRSVLYEPKASGEGGPTSAYTQ